jgi:hypothetical protein
MSAEAPLLSRSWKVGRYVATITIPKINPGVQLHATMDWQPTKPARLTGEELVQYRHGRDAALAEIAKTLRVNVAVVEV